jgi:hypothetical protein
MPRRQTVLAELPGPNIVSTVSNHSSALSSVAHCANEVPQVRHALDDFCLRRQIVRFMKALSHDHA